MSSAKSKGMHFLPDNGDQVLVAFERGNISHPVVVGCLWSAKSPRLRSGRLRAKQAQSDRTKSNVRVEFDETEGDEHVTIAHPKEARLRSGRWEVRIRAERIWWLSAK